MHPRNLVVIAVVSASLLAVSLAGTLTTAQATCYPVIDHVEFTQEIQTGTNPSDPQFDTRAGIGHEPIDVPIVARPLTLRFYIKKSSGCNDDPIEHVDIVDAGYSLANQAPSHRSGSDNGPIVIDEPFNSPRWDRHDPDSTLNVTLTVPDLADDY